VVFSLAEYRVGRHRAQRLGDLRLGQGPTVDAVPAPRLHSLGKQLNGTDAVAADGFEQGEGVDRPGLVATRHPLADLLVVRQQVVEVVRHHLAANLQRRRDRQGQRQRAALRRREPGWVVGESMGPSVDGPRPDELAVHPGGEAGAHQLPVLGAGAGLPAPSSARITSVAPRALRTFMICCRLTTPGLASISTTRAWVTPIA